MKALEFETSLHSSDAIEIPELYQDQFSADQNVRVIALIEDKEDKDSGWQDIVTRQLFSGYTDADAEYDKL
jgi:hypothetical protein